MHACNEDKVPLSRSFTAVSPLGVDASVLSLIGNG